MRPRRRLALFAHKFCSFVIFLYFLANLQTDRTDRQTERTSVLSFYRIVHSTHLTQSLGLNRALAINHVICQAACLLRRLHLYLYLWLYTYVFLLFCSHNKSQTNLLSELNMCTLLYESVLYLDKNKRRINYLAFTNLSLSFNDGFYIEIFAYINSRHTCTQHMIQLCVR